jgi:hypothetical protein
MNDFVPCQFEEVFRPPPFYEWMTCAQLASGHFEQEYLIERVLVGGQPCIIGGARKSLKTSIMIDLAITLATGGTFLGRFPASRRCRVAVMSGESGLATIQETARRVASASGVELGAIEDLLWSTSLPKFGDPQHLLALDRFVRENKTEVLVIDPAYLAMPSTDSGNLFAQGELLRGMNDVCQAHNVTMLLCHHMRKGKATKAKPPELDELAWAGFQEWARQWLLLSRRAKYQPGSGRHELWLSVGGSAGHSGEWAVDIAEGVYDGFTPRRWEVKVNALDESEGKSKKAEMTLAGERAKLLEAARKHPQGETLRTLRTMAKIDNGTRASQVLDALISSGDVRLGTITKNGRKHKAVIPTLSAENLNEHQPK